MLLHGNEPLGAVGHVLQNQVEDVADVLGERQDVVVEAAVEYREHAKLRVVLEHHELREMDVAKPGQSLVQRIDVLIVESLQRRQQVEDAVRLQRKNQIEPILDGKRLRRHEYLSETTGT